MSVCYNCNREINAEFPICPFCGAAQYSNENPQQYSNSQNIVKCPGCGIDLYDNTNFCPDCGTPIAASIQSNGAVSNNSQPMKCPWCGEILRSFASKCPACGNEIRNLHAPDSVSMLANELQQLEYSRVSGVGNEISKTDQQKISLIRNFAIPNTKEDLLEFMILAHSNINVNVYGVINTFISTGAEKAKKELSDAWIAKFDQTYHKAAISLKGDKDFKELEALYLQKKEELRLRHTRNAMIIGILTVVALMLILLKINPKIVLGIFLTIVSISAIVAIVIACVYIARKFNEADPDTDDNTINKLKEVISRKTSYSAEYPQQDCNNSMPTQNQSVPEAANNAEQPVNTPEPVQENQQNI